MKQFAVALAFVLSVTILTPSAHSLEISEYNITFDILPNGFVKEDIFMEFSEPLNESTLNYVVLGEIYDLRIRGSEEENVDYILEKKGNERTVKFAVPKNTKTLHIDFVAKDLVFTRDSIHGFFASLQPPRARNVRIEIFLPKGFAVYRDVIYPEGYETLTDGERIYLRWEFERPEEFMISFKFYSIYTDYSLAIFVVMVFSLLAVTAYLVSYYRKRVKGEFLRGFSEDEIKVLNILSERKVCMQNRLEKELGFSRAKMTRIVKRLEGKGLLEKEKVGRTNRIYWKR